MIDGWKYEDNGSLEMSCGQYIINIRQSNTAVYLK